MKTTILTAVTLLGSLLPAQGYSVVPARFTQAKGTFYSSYWFAAYQEQRLQLAEGELPAGPQVITGFGLRSHAGWASLINFTAQGHRYANLTVQCAEGDHKTLGPNFATNLLSRPKTVFSGPVSFPRFSAPQPTVAPWSTRYAYPFRLPYVHLGRRDLLLDCTFRGGTLDNNQPWTGPVAYPFDADAFGNAFGSWWDVYPSGCRDTNWSFAAATTELSVVLYGPTHPSAWRNKAQVLLSGRQYPFGTPVTSMVGVGGSAGGSTFPGITCGRLHVDPNLPFVLESSVAQRPARPGRPQFIRRAAGTQNPVSYNSALIGFPLYAQSAWLDSVTRRLKLSSGARTEYPEMPPATVARAAVAAASATAKAGSVGRGIGAVPIIRYRH